MLSYEEITYVNVPVLFATAIALWVLTNACMTNPLMSWLYAKIVRMDSDRVAAYKKATLELSQNCTMENMRQWEIAQGQRREANGKNKPEPPRLTSEERRERQAIVGSYSMPTLKKWLLYPFNCQLCQAFWVSFFAYLATGSDRSSWIMSPLMYAGLVLVLSRLIPEGVAAIRTGKPGNVARSSCGGQ